MGFLSRLFFTISIVSSLLVIFLVWQRTTPRRLQFDHSVQYSSERQSEKSGIPTGISIPAIGVWLPVFPTTIKDNQWVTTSRGVSFIQNSGIPGVSGNSIFYGHNWSNLLGSLPSIKPGDIIEIITNDSSRVVFEVQTTQTVDPSDTSVLSQTQEPQITIYTCNGFLDSTRFVVVATLVV